MNVRYCHQLLSLANSAWFYMIIAKCRIPEMHGVLDSGAAWVGMHPLWIAASLHQNPEPKHPEKELCRMCFTGCKEIGVG